MAKSKYQAYETETISRDQIKNAPYNPRIMDDGAKKRLKKNIARHGLVSALTWNKRTGNLVGGHQRLEQLDALEKRGICPDDIGNAGKAAMLIDRLEKRQHARLTTPKQIRFLEGRGFQHVGTWEFEQARKLIDRIAANGWKVPFDINPHSYRPAAEVPTPGIWEGYNPWMTSESF